MVLAVKLPSKIIGLAVLWDEETGRTYIVSEIPPLSLPDSNAAAMEIYIATAAIFGQEDYFSCTVTELPFPSLTADHIAKVAFDSWAVTTDSGEEKNYFGFIAFIMDKSTAQELDSFLSLAIQCFLNDFKRERTEYNLTLAWNALFTYLHVNKNTTTSKEISFVRGSYYRIAIAGLKMAGKTATLQRLLTGRFIPDTQPTQGAECELFSRGNAKFQVTDLGGQESFINSLWQSFMLKANAMVYVIDTSDVTTLANSRDTLNLAVSWNSDVKVLLILANKQDLIGAMDKESLAEYLNLDNLIIGTGIESYKIVETSARTGQNVEMAFNWLASQLTGQENLKSVNILSVYVFKKTGQPIAAGHGPTSELAQVNMMSPKEDFMLISGVYSAIGAFVSQVFKGQIVTVEIKGSHGRTYKLVNVEKDNYLCLLLVDGKDDLVTIEAIGNVFIRFLLI